MGHTVETTDAEQVIGDRLTVFKGSRAGWQPIVDLPIWGEWAGCM